MMYDAQTLHFGDEALKPAIDNADKALQRLLKNMVEKGSTQGSLTIKIDIEMAMKVVQNFDPAINGDTRTVLVPTISHKVGSVMQIKDETKGSTDYDGYELVWDEDRGEFVMRPISTAQQSIFDAAYVVVPNDSEMREPSAALESGDSTMLPAHTEDEFASDGGDVEEAVKAHTNSQVTPFEYLRQFIGEELRITEAAGNYTARSSENKVILSSAFSPTDRFYCSADVLKRHVGHKVECVGYGQEEIVNVSIECVDCNEVLFSIDAEGDAEDDDSAECDEDDDLSDAFAEGYDYEPPQG